MVKFSEPPRCDLCLPFSAIDDSSWILWSTCLWISLLPFRKDMDGISMSSSEPLLAGVAAVASSGCSEGLVGAYNCWCSCSSVFEILCSIDDSLELTEFSAFKMSWLTSVDPLASITLESLTLE